jgi:hypothetical protein
MDKRDLIKKNIFRLKLEQYFAKNTSAKSVIVKSNVGNKSTFWRAVKDKNNFYITEVNTLRESFIINEDSPENELPPNVGLETSIDTPPEPDVQVKSNQDQEDSNDPPPPNKKKTEDQGSLSRTLKGQTISGVEFETSTAGCALAIDLVGSTIPARLEWKNSGQVIYYFNGVPYVLKTETIE